MAKKQQPQQNEQTEAEPERTFGELLQELLARVEFATYTTLTLLLLAIGYFWPRIFIVVPAGHRGVMFRYFKGGTVTERIWGEGLNIIPPWDTLSLYDVRLQQVTLQLKVLSDEGLGLGATVAVSYRLNQDMLGYLQQDVGANFFERLIRPQVESHVRRVFGARPTHEIYASAGGVLQELSRVPTIGGLVHRAGSPPAFSPYVDTLELKLMSMDLPKVVENAIVEKFHQEQLLLEYRYKLEREQKEAERKRTEAAGVRDYMTITGLQALDFLRGRSIDAALDLAKSSNSKILMLGGGGAGGLPVMLNLGDGSASPAAPADAAPAEPRAEKPARGPAAAAKAPPAPAAKDTAPAKGGPAPPAAAPASP